MSWEKVPFDRLYIEPSRNGVYKSKEFHGEGYKIVNMGEIFGFEFIGNQDMNRIKMSDSEIERSGLVDGDLLFGRRSLIESGAGKCSIIVAPPETLTFESSIIRVRLDKNKANPLFYYYWFKSYIGRSGIKAIVSGTNVKGIRSSDLRNITVALPEKKIQDNIAAFFKKYDDLIENNRRRIQLLEESARLLYREWFVHLRFPGHEHVKIVEGVPDGWHNLPASKICLDIKDSVKPEDIDLNTPYIGLEHIPRRSITLSTWETAEKVTSNKYLFKSGDIIFGKIRPYFHKIGFTLCDGITSSDAIVIRPTEQKCYFYCLMYLSSDYFISLASKTVKEGSKMPRADWAHLLTTNVILPPDSLLTTFDSQISTIVLQLKALSLQNHSLIKASTYRLK